MKLGIDGWRIHGGTGVARYLTNLVQRWPGDYGSRFTELNLYTPRPVDREKVPLSEAVRECVVPSDARQLLWQNRVLARACRDDVLWCPGYVRPLRTSARVVVTTHDATNRINPELYPRRDRIFYGRFYGWCARHASLVLTHNEITREDIATHYGVARERIRIVPLAPAEIFEKLDDRRAVERVVGRLLGGGHLYFLNVGKVSIRRNVPTIIEAFAEFKRATDLPYKLVVVGKNGLPRSPVESAKALGIAEDFVYLDYASDDDLVALYNGARGFVSAATYESVSFTTLEAQATGTPVIIPDTPGLRATTGDHALIVPRVGVPELAEAMARLARDEGLHERLVDAGLDYAATLSWDRTARETLAVLEEAAAMDPPTRLPRAS